MRDTQKRLCIVIGLFTLLNGCTTTKRAVVPLKPPPERLECQTAGTRPIIPPEHVIDWTRVVTAGDARAQHEAFVTKLREREGLITGYLVRIEGANFICASNARWLRDWYAAIQEGP